MPNAISKLLRKGAKGSDSAVSDISVYTGPSSTSHDTTPGQLYRPQVRRKGINRSIGKSLSALPDNKTSPNELTAIGPILAPVGTSKEDIDDSWEVVAPAVPKALLSTRVEVQFDRDIANLEKQKAMLDMGISAISLCQGIAEVVLPRYVGTALRKVANLLGVLKKMVENKEAWRELISTIDDHQRIFNEQLRRLDREDLIPYPDSPLLAPVKQYAEALERMTAKILQESGVVVENAPQNSIWGKIQTFTTRFIDAESERDGIEGCTIQLKHSMEQFKVALALFTGFTVNDIKIGVENVTFTLHTVNERLEDMNDRLARLSEPPDTIGARNITPFGGQHNTCLEGTRMSILEEIHSWAFSSVQRSIYCIGDAAGTGKSTIAKTLANRWYQDGDLAAMFFFSQEGDSVRNARDFCVSVADQIEEAFSSPEVTAYWESIAKSRKNLGSRDIEEQWTKLVHLPLSMLKRNKPYLLVIDALDECTIATRSPLLRCILRTFSSQVVPVARVLLTTRNEQDLLEMLQADEYSSAVLWKTLHSPVNPNANADIMVYIEHRLKQMPGTQLTPEERIELVERCDGLFVFAFLACELLQEAYNMHESLKHTLTGFTSLDALYHRTLTRADTAPPITRDALKTVLGVVVVAEVPLSVPFFHPRIPSTSVELLVNLAA